MSVVTTNYRTEFATEGDGIVVDLSEHANKFMQYEDIAADLTQAQESRLVDYVKSAMLCLTIKSHVAMSIGNKRIAHDVYVRPDTTAFREKANSRHSRNQ